MTHNYYLIPKNELPEGFIYPKSYLHYLKYNETQEETRELECWDEVTLMHFEEDRYHSVAFFYNQLKYEYPNRNFVPFARRYDDIVYCFDGDDTLGNPSIYEVQVFLNKWGIEHQEFTILYNDFYQWLIFALEEGQEECAKWRGSFPLNKLPDGFQYPKEYINKVKIWNVLNYYEEIVDHTSFLLNEFDIELFKKGAYPLKLSNNQHFTLVPFAGQYLNHYAFDGGDTSGDPRVYILNKEETEILDIYPNFQSLWDDIPLLEKKIVERARKENEK